MSDWTDLHLASWRGDLDTVKTLIQHGSDVNSTDKYGWTPLHLACQEGHLDVVSYLCSQGSNLRAADNYGRRPLHWACRDGDLDTVKILIQHGSDVNCTDDNGQTPLHLACGNGDLDTVKTLIQQGSDVNCTDGNGRTPLHVACGAGHLDVVSYLCSQGSNPQAANMYGETPLHDACRNGDLDTVKTLIQQGSDVNCADADGWTPLHCACGRGYLDTVKTLIQQGSDVNCADAVGWTPLHLACQQGHLDVVSYLCSQASYPQAATNDGWTPLHFACMERHLDIVSYLCSQGSNPETADKYGETPLHYACSEGHLDVVSYLCSKGSNPQAADIRGRTPLHYACNNKQAEIVKFLLREAHCDPNVVDKEGSTPLAMTTDPTTTRQLIINGAHASKLYEKLLPQGYSKKPTESAVKVFIVGKQGMGKTTLTIALKKEGNIITYFAKRMLQVSQVEKNTAGVIPHDIHSKSLGRTTLYDFAGHEEFYSSHDVMLRSSIVGSPSVFLLVTNLCLSDDEFRQSILSWLSFLENQGISEDPKPHIIIVGSHADTANSADVQTKEGLVTAIASSLALSSFHFAGFVPLDCRYAESPSMSKLRKQMSESCNSLRHKTEMTLSCHCLRVYLLDKFQDSPAVRVWEALAYVQESVQAQSGEIGFLSFISDDHVDLCKLLLDLHERGSILLLRDTEKFENSWLILDREAILSKITGTVFAPNSDDFKQFKTIATSTGVVPFSRIETAFLDADLNPNMITEFLCQFEFCQEITDAEGKQLLQVATALSSTGDVTTSDDAPVANRLTSTCEKFFFFPGLVKTDVPKDVWECSSEYGYYSGWVLQSSQSDKFFTHRFLHILLIRLAFCFALTPEIDATNSQLPTIRRKCSIWKNGIHWGDRSGTEALVELVEGSRRVNVMVRCLIGNEMECIHLRSALIRRILSAKDELCPRVPAFEAFLLPSDSTSHPLKSITEVRYASCTEIAKAVTAGQGSVVDQLGRVMALGNLLYFEPYAHLGEHILRELFDEENCERTVSNEFLYRIADCVYQKKDKFIDIFKPPATLLHDRIRHAPQGPTHELVEVFKIWGEQSEGSYQCLRLKLDQFSIFAGRNPLGTLTLADKKGDTEVASKLRAQLNVTDKDAGPLTLAEKEGCTEVASKQINVTDKDMIPDTDEKKECRDTWEYKTFRKNSAVLAGWLGTIGNAQMIASELYARHLIGLPTKDEAGIYGPKVTERMRIFPILKEMETQIQIKKENYKKFRDVLLLPHVLGPAAQDGMDIYLPANNPEGQAMEETKTEIVS